MPYWDHVLNEALALTQVLFFLSWGREKGVI